MPTAAKTSEDFTTAMQQLSAEAAKLIPGIGAGKGGKQISPSQESTALNQRLNEIEQSLSRKLDLLAARVPMAQDVDLGSQFAKIDEQLSVIRNTDQMNKRLVDSLHEELSRYRDNFVHESLQKPFIHDLVHLFDDLTSLSEQLRTASDQKSGRARLGQWLENLENSIHSLLEVLHRLEVKEIESKEMVDRALHKVMNFEPAEFAEDDGRIVMRVKRGFVWRGKVIRPEEVIAKKFR